MWVIPVGLCIRNHWWRFPCVWLLFSAITSVVTKKSLEKPIEVRKISKQEIQSFGSGSG